MDYLSDSGAFVDYIKDDIETNFSKHQLMCKIRKLKKKFRDNSAKNPCFTKSHDSEIFNLSMAIWGKDKAECVDGNMDKANGSKSKVSQGFTISLQLYRCVVLFNLPHQSSDRHN